MSTLLQEIKISLIKKISYFLFNKLANTWHYHIVGEEHIKNNIKHGYIIVCWHDQQIVPIFYMRNRGYYALASFSRDGDYISNILENLNWQTVRGSTSRGGTRSLIKIMKLLRDKKYVAITPDGPRGPKHKLQSGCLYLAQKTKTPIIPISVACDRKWILTQTWDEFIIPKPFAQCAIYYGEPIWIKEELNEDQLFLETKRVNDALHESSKKADAFLKTQTK